MVISGVPLRDERVVSVGLNSTVIAGVNAKRFRLTVYPTSANPVYVSSTGAPTLNGGATVVNGTPPVRFGGEGEGTAFGQSIQAIAQVAGTNVLVVDEFWG